MSVVTDPLQIAATLATVTLGIGFTVTVAFAEEDGHPAADTVTEYVWLLFGFTDMD